MMSVLDMKSVIKSLALGALSVSAANMNLSAPCSRPILGLFRCGAAGLTKTALGLRRLVDGETIVTEIGWPKHSRRPLACTWEWS